MKQRLLRGVSLLLVLVMLSALLTGCGEKGKVKALIADFEEACQEADMSEILDCIDPEVIKPVKSIMGLFGIDVSAVADLISSVIRTDSFGLPDLGELLETQGMKDELAALRIKPKSYSFNKGKSECRVQVTYSGTFRGEDFSHEGELACVLRDGEWYLAGIG